MKKLLIVVYILFLSSVMADAGLTDLEKKFFDVFANYTGNMGIGFVPKHTFDYGFRQAILQSKDEDVQKAFILHMLPGEIDGILATLKTGKKMIGKGQYEKLSEDERKSLIVRFKECMTLMEKLDAGKNKHFYSEYQSQMDNIVGKTKKMMRTSRLQGSASRVSSLKLEFVNFTVASLPQWFRVLEF